MREFRSPVWYKHFQRHALVLAFVLSVTGLLLGNNALTVTGLFVGAHGLVALTIIMIEERRMVEREEFYDQ